MEIEISIGHREPQSIYTEFEHYVYCDTIDEAIKVLQELEIKEIKTIILEHTKSGRCNKCVYEYTCHKTDINGNCTDYKRDPPDGGYYG